MLSAGSGGLPKAAIVDQLSLTLPNPVFVQQATALLQQAGYEVDYLPGEEVTVDFFRNLPARGYEYLILRVHSSATLREEGRAASTENTVLFTGEPWSQTKYLEDQEARHLALTHYSADDPAYYFGITPDFIGSRVKGNFHGATIILMGCDGLKSESAARAFVDRGAKAVMGWDGSVSAEHTDAATERLLQHLVVDKLGTQEAVRRTMTEVGPDPQYGSELVYYPSEG
jgi:hypothetical protein